MARRGIPVWQYDYTVTGPPFDHPLFSFQPWRIGATEDGDLKTVSLAGLIERNGHHDRSDFIPAEGSKGRYSAACGALFSPGVNTPLRAAGSFILKMDIEGAEWDVLAAIDPDRLRVFRQILIEFHSLDQVVKPGWKDRAITALDHLCHHHQVVHVHGNNLSRILVAGDLRMTESIEVTLVRRDAYRLVATDETFPGPLDRANSRIFRDFPLGKFCFDGDQKTGRAISERVAKSESA